MIMARPGKKVLIQAELCQQRKLLPFLGFSHPTLPKLLKQGRSLSHRFYANARL
jgi:hypothetical protein